MRHDFYTTIHKAIRRELAGILTSAGALDTPSEWTALAARASSLAAVLDAHAGHEDRFIHPLLAQVAPTVATRLDREHDALDRKMRAAIAAMGAASAADAASAAYRALSAFTTGYLEHMEVEEAEAMPAIWTRWSDGELRAIHAELVGSIEPAAMESFLRIMIPAISLAERVDLLAGVRMAVPPPVFAGVLALSEQLLPPSALMATRDALAGGAP